MSLSHRDHIAHRRATIRPVARPRARSFTLTTILGLLGAWFAPGADGLTAQQPAPAAPPGFCTCRSAASLRTRGSCRRTPACGRRLYVDMLHWLEIDPTAVLGGAFERAGLWSV